MNLYIQKEFIRAVGNHIPSDNYILDAVQYRKKMQRVLKSARVEAVRTIMNRFDFLAKMESRENFKYPLS